MQVAVIQSYKTVAWYGGTAEGPRAVTGRDAGANGGLQVVDLAGLDAVLGRIPRLKYRTVQGNRILLFCKDIVFDPSMGRLRS